MKIFLLIIAFAQSVLLIAQNLVPNPSFEEYYDCPYKGGQIDFVKEWGIPVGSKFTPEYFNSCGRIGVPNNHLGIQFAKTGNAYVGIIGCYFVDNSDHREYITARLTNALKSNSIYYCSFYVSLAESSKKEISTIGAYFSETDTLPLCNNMLCNIEPQIESNSKYSLKDMVNWVEIKGIYKAQGNEQFITIGNFREDINSGILPSINNNDVNALDMAYYYIDDVCVSLNPADFGIDTTTTSITNIAKPQFDLLLYPNPASAHIEISYMALPGTHYSYEIVDLLGRVLLKSEQMSDTGYEVVEVKALASGMYFFKCMVNGNVAQTNTFIVKH